MVMKYILLVIISTRNSLAEGKGEAEDIWCMREWYKHSGNGKKANGKKETTCPVENRRRWSIKSVSYEDIGDNDDDDSHSSHFH